MPRLSAPGFLLLLTALALSGAARAGEFEEGLARFSKAAETRSREGDAAARELFRQAAARWEALAAKGTVSTRLFTNIGNARAFAGDLGEAVLAYRRALVVDPRNERARRALLAIRSTLGIEDAGRSAESGLVHALFFWHGALSFPTRRTLFAIAWVAGFLLLLLCAGGRAGVQARFRRLRLPAYLLLVVAAALLTSLAISDAKRPGRDQAVLMVRTQGRTGDGSFYSASHTDPLPAGVELTVLERRGGPAGWVQARLRDDSTTWLPGKSVAFVLP